MLNLILGRPECGHRAMLAEGIGRVLERGGHALLLVPDQFTLSAERDVLQRLGLRGSMDLEVLSFNRLAWRVFEASGGVTLEHLNEQGKAMVMRLLLDESAAQLSVFRSVAGHKGFALSLIDAIEKLRAADITPECLTEYSQRGGIMESKLQDVALLYGQYNAYMAERYLDAASMMKELKQRIYETELVRGSHIFADGFSVFTEQLYGVLTALLECAPSLSIALPYSAEGEEEHEIFEVQRKVRERLLTIAQERGHEVKEYYAPVSDKTPALLHMATNLYAYPPIPYDNEPGEIEIYLAQSIASEVEASAARVCELVRSGARYNQITVTCGDLEVYGPVIERTYRSYNIPFFMDMLRPTHNHPLIDAVLALLSMCVNSFDRTSFLRYLKSGFAGVEREVCDRIEQFCSERGIRGGDIQYGYARKRSIKENERATLFEEVRRQAILPIVELNKQLKGKNAREMAELLIDFIQNDAYPGLNETLSARQAENGFMEEARQSEQAVNIVTDTLVQLAAILGDRPLTLEQFADILEEGLEAAQTGIIPTTLDQVLVGDISRTKSASVRYGLILGVNDGVLPRIRPISGLFSDVEVIELKENGVDFGMEPAELDATEKLEILSAFTRPDQSLIVSCSLSDIEGRAAGRSQLIDKLYEMFPHIVEHSELRESPERFFLTPHGLVTHMGRALRAQADGQPVRQHCRWQDAYRVARESENEEIQTRLQLYSRAIANTNAPVRVDATVMRKLFQGKKANISRLETYASCSFRHFVEYALSPYRWKEYRMESLDYGNLLHGAFEGLGTELKCRPDAWRTIEPTESDRIIDRAIDGYVQGNESDKFTDTPTNRAMVQKLKRIARRAARLTIEQIQGGTFVPQAFEFSFQTISDADLALNGRIDRIDILEEDGRKYLRIVDYKTGERKLDYTMVYYGLQLQLFVYLREALKRFPDTTAGGAFFFHMFDPIVSVDSPSDTAEIESKRLEKARLSGLYVCDPTVQAGMDQTGESKIVSKKDGVERELFDSILEHALDNARTLAQGLLSGDNTLNPYKTSKSTACDYCNYKSVCGFDERYADNEFRRLDKKEKEDFLPKGGGEHAMDGQPTTGN